MRIHCNQIATIINKYRFLITNHCSIKKQFVTHYDSPITRLPGSKIDSESSAINTISDESDQAQQSEYLVQKLVIIMLS